jgi:hypothetical protein
VIYRNQNLLPDDLQDAREAAGILLARLVAVRQRLPAGVDELRSGLPRLSAMRNRLAANPQQFSRCVAAILSVERLLTPQRSPVQVGPLLYKSVTEGVADLAWRARSSLRELCDVATMVHAGRISPEEANRCLARLRALVGGLSIQALDVDLDSEFLRTAAQRSKAPQCAVGPGSKQTPKTKEMR